MATIGLMFTCPECANKTQFAVRKPNHFEPSIAKVRCNNGCESSFHVAVDREGPGKCKIDVIGIQLSQKALKNREDKLRGSTPINASV